MRSNWIFILSDLLRYVPWLLLGCHLFIANFHLSITLNLNHKVPLANADKMGIYNVQKMKRKPLTNHINLKMPCIIFILPPLKHNIKVLLITKVKQRLNIVLGYWFLRVNELLPKILLKWYGKQLTSWSFDKI